MAKEKTPTQEAIATFDPSINETNLHLEWKRQVEMMATFTKLAAKARRVAKRAKAEVKVAMSQVRRSMLESPADFELPKTTEAVVEGAILEQQEYITAFKAQIDAEFEADILEGAVNTLRDRREALDNLTYLWSQGYFGSMPPKGTGEVAEAVQRADRKAVRGRAVRQPEDTDADDE